MHHVNVANNPAADDPNLKRGLIEEIFSDFKVISEKELYDMMIAQRNSLDNSNRFPENPFERQPNFLEVQNPAAINIHHPWNIGRVDEVDDMQDAMLEMQRQILQDRVEQLQQRILGHPDNLFPNFAHHFMNREQRDILLAGHPMARLNRIA